MWNWLTCQQLCWKNCPLYLMSAVLLSFWCVPLPSRCPIRSSASSTWCVINFVTCRLAIFWVAGNCNLETPRFSIVNAFQVQWITTQYTLDRWTVSTTERNDWYVVIASTELKGGSSCCHTEFCLSPSAWHWLRQKFLTISTYSDGSVVMDVTDVMFLPSLSAKNWDSVEEQLVQEDRP